MGKITKTHGVDGEVYVLPLTDDPARFTLLSDVLIEENGLLKKYKVDHARVSGGRTVLKLSGVNDKESAEHILGRYILINKADAVQLPEDSFFISDIVGCEVIDEGGTVLGKVTDVLQTGGNDVYTVTDPSGKEILMPALKSVFIKVDIKKKILTARLPEGLV